MEALGRLGDFELVTATPASGSTSYGRPGLRAGTSRRRAGPSSVEMVPGGQRHDLLLVAVE